MSTLLLIFILIYHPLKVLSQVCPDGWNEAGGRCYRLTPSAPEDWGYAEDECFTLRPDARLVSFIDETEADIVVLGKCAGQATTTFWTGLNDLADEAGTIRNCCWTFSDGTDPTYIRYYGEKYWNNSQPNNRFNSEDCVAVVNGRLDDRACTMQYPACCANVPSPSPSPSQTPTQTQT